MSMGSKFVATAVMALTGFTAGKLIEKIWERATKNPVPREDDETVSIAQLVIFTALSASIVAVVQHFAMKKVNQLYKTNGSDSQTDSTMSTSNIAEISSPPHKK